MNKNDLIGAVAETSGLSKSQAASAVESVFESISTALKKGDEVRLVGFGTFSVAKRKASTGRNPRTGEPCRSGVESSEVQGRQGPRFGQLSTPRSPAPLDSTGLSGLAFGQISLGRCGGNGV